MIAIEPLLEGCVYHVYTHANGHENLFLQDENFNFFLKKYRDYIYPIANTYAYCLMPNHLHLMVRMRNQTEVIDNLVNKKLQLIKEGKPTLQVELTLTGFQTLSGLVRSLHCRLALANDALSSQTSKVLKTLEVWVAQNKKTSPFARGGFFI